MKVILNFAALSVTLVSMVVVLFFGVVIGELHSMYCRLPGWVFCIVQNRKDKTLCDIYALGLKIGGFPIATLSGALLSALMPDELPFPKHAQAFTTLHTGVLYHKYTKQDVYSWKVYAPSLGEKISIQGVSTRTNKSVSFDIVSKDFQRYLDKCQEWLGE